jgi:hypothetical protein
MNVFVWFQNTHQKYHGLLFHVANENQSGKRGKKLQMMGQVPGVADLLCFASEEPYAIELKRPDGKGSQSPAQKKWQKQWESMGRQYFVMNDFEEIKQLINDRIAGYEWLQQQLNM